MQRMLGAGLTEHLGCAHGDQASPVQANRRNGTSRKTVVRPRSAGRSTARM